MIADIHHQAGNATYNHNLALLDDLLVSEVFLRGLSPSFDGMSADSSLVKSFTVIDNIAWAAEMLDFDGDQKKQCPYTYRYYAGMHNFAHLSFCERVERSKEKEVMDLYRKNMDGNTNYYFVQNSAKASFDALDISNHLLKQYRNPTLSREDIAFNVTDRLYMQIQDDFDLMIRACYFDAFENDAYCQRLYQAYQTGGMPCGWLGETDYQDGADPYECLALFHMHAKE